MAVVVQTMATRAAETHVDGSQIVKEIALWGLVGKAAAEAVWPLRKMLIRALGGTINGNGRAAETRDGIQDRRRGDTKIGELIVLVESGTAAIGDLRRDMAGFQLAIVSRVADLEGQMKRMHEGDR